MEDEGIAPNTSYCLFSRYGEKVVPVYTIFWTFYPCLPTGSAVRDVFVGAISSSSILRVHLYNIQPIRLRKKETSMRGAKKVLAPSKSLDFHGPPLVMALARK